MRDKIESYLLEELSVEEMHAFEQAMSSDAKLRSEVEQMRAIIKGLERRAERDALNAMQRVESEEQLRKIINQIEGHKEQKQGVKISFRLFAIGVSSVAAAVIFLLGFMPQYSTDTLFEQTFVVESNIESTPSRGDSELNREQIEILSSGANLFDAGNYAQAVDVYRKVITEDNMHIMPEDALICYSLSLINVGEMEQAIKMLDVVARDENAELQDMARWYVAVTQIKLGNRGKAVAQLEVLIEQGGERAKQAAELKSKIEEKRWF